MNFIFEVHLRRTTNPLGSRSNPEGSKIEPFWVRSRTQKGSKNDELFGFEDRTPLGSISNPEGFEDRTLLGSCLRTQKGSCLRTLLGSIFEPSGFEIEPRGFVLRTLWVPRTQKGSKIEPSWVSNPSGFVEPRGFDLEPRRVRRYEPFWVRGTQRVRRTNPLGSWNPEGSKIEPRRVRRHEPFWVRRHEPRRGFDLRTLWVRSRTQRVRRSSKMNFEDEVHLRRTKMKFIFELQKNFFFFFFLGGDPDWISTVHQQ
ncbi:hypothetical protein ACOSP7_000332 [Xanthoceras sorbifolium]